MRWNINKPKPNIGDRRSRQVFAWLPEDVKEWRVWLEHYEVYEEYKLVDTFDEMLDEVIKVERWVELDRNILGYL